MGGFTANGFVESQREGSQEVFLFCAREKNIVVLRVKEGRKGVVPDPDFLIFGNEELSLEQNCDYATSYSSPNLQTLHF